MSTRTKVVLTKLVVFSPNDLVDDRLCVLIPMLCPAAVTNPDGDFDTTKNIAFIGRLAESDPLIASGDAATLAKIAALQVGCVGHGPHRSSTPYWQRPTSVCTPCVNYFTQSVQIRHAVIRSFLLPGRVRAECVETVDNWCSTRADWRSALGGTRLRFQGWVVRRPASIQNNSGLFRKIQVCPKDLPIRSIAG
jgi:hypothetical protein